MPRRKEVDAWFARYENPKKDVVLRIREIVLRADSRIDECIKWQAPTFTFEGNLASFFPKSKQHATLMFHQGAKIPGRHPLLKGTGGTSRSVKLASVAEATSAKKGLVAIVRAWCDWRTAGQKTTAAAKKSPNKKAKRTTTKKASPATQATNKESSRKQRAKKR